MREEGEKVDKIMSIKEEGIEASRAYRNHKKTIERYRNELLEAEATVRRIRDSHEWKLAMNYFALLGNRGYLEERVTFENGYQIKFKEGVEK